MTTKKRPLPPPPNRAIARKGGTPLTTQQEIGLGDPQLEPSLERWETIQRSQRYPNTLL